MAGRKKDYFSFETIRDRDGSIVCYHVTMIGTVEEGGLATIRSDLGENNDQRMAFARLTLYDLDKKISKLLTEVGGRAQSFERFEDGGSRYVISYTAKDWRADEVGELQEGDRVLIEGRAYLRAPSAKNPTRAPEVSVTATGVFLLGRARPKFVNTHMSLQPQE